MKEKHSLRVKNIDILKAVCAFFVVCIHAPFPGTAGEYFIALTRIAVPIFFMITGYFYTDVGGGQTRQIKKILKLSIEANIIYLLWDCFHVVVKQNLDFFQSKFTLKNLFKFLLLNESPLKGHLWYLGAILYVLLIVYFADKLNCRRLLYYLTPVLLLGNLVFGKYAILIWGREFPVILVRNFLFVGLPYFCIGIWIRMGFAEKIKKKTLRGLMLVFCLTTLLERFILVRTGMNARGEQYISTIFLAATVFLFVLKAREKHGEALATVGRKYSTWLYILHPIFISGIRAIANKFGVYEVYKWVAPIVVYISTLVFLMVLERLFIARKRNVYENTL